MTQLQQSNIEKLARRYEKQPVLRSLIQLIPFGFGSAIDAAVLTRLQNISEERTRTFFDELSKGNIKLKPELLESEDFLHCYFATVKAALNSRRQEKIRMFARLLKSSTLPDSFLSTDEYEEYLKILDELSYRELLILFILEKYESNSISTDDKTGAKAIHLFWERFIDEIEATFGISDGEINALLTRLNRTGCYETQIYQNFPGNPGTLTPMYFRLKKLIGNEGE